MPAQANARLTRVASAAGATDDWDRATAPAPPDKWAGELDAYVRESVRRDPGAGELNVYTARTAWVDTDALDAAVGPDGLDTDDVVTLELDDGRVITSPAVTVARSRLAGAELVATTRIDLENA